MRASVVPARLRLTRLAVEDGSTRCQATTIDQVNRSVRVRVRRGEKIVVDLYREPVALLTVPGDDVVIEQRETPYRGRTVVTVVLEFLVPDAVIKA
jgi:hypothetical protein